MTELQDTFAEVMQAARNLGKIDSGLEHEMTIYRDTYYGLLDRLQEAHDRELSEARNPSHACMCKNKREHERELERMREYDRGRRDGLHRRDTDMWQLEHERAVATRRLLELTFDALDSHHNLAAIANAVWGAAPVAWSQESCHALALRLAWMLGGDGTAEDVMDGYIELPKDADGDYIHVGDTVGHLGEQYEVKAIVHDGSDWHVSDVTWHRVKADACRVLTDERPDSYDAIARDLINGTCTRCEGVQRMEAMNG